MDLHEHPTLQRGNHSGRGARHIVAEVFEAFESGSIQQVIYQMGTRVLEEIPAIRKFDLEANNRTWDTIAEQGDSWAFIPMRGRPTAASA